MSNPKVSVIVPIYGVEQYLRQCVDSILAQTLHDIEIILVNDGSPDACPQIIDEYAQRDSRIVAAHLTNGGYGRAVNHGIRMARGEYIGIIEPDDWAEADMYDILYRIATEHQVEVVRCNYYRYTQAHGDEMVHMLPSQDMEKVISPKEHSDVFYCRATVWAALYHRPFLEENDIQFLESPGASYQDIGFNFKVLARSTRLWLTPHALVHYRSDNEHSSTRSDKKVYCIADEWKEVERYMSRYPEDYKASYVLRCHIRLDQYMWNLKRLKGPAREEFRAYVVAEYRDLLRQGVIQKECYTHHKWMAIIRCLNPHSIRPFIIWLSHLIMSVIIKTKVKVNKRSWHLFFGLIKIYEKDIRRPTFYGEQY